MEEEHGWLRMLFLAGGVLITFTCFGWAQEQVTRGVFGANNERFQDTSFLVLIQGLCNSLIAGLLLVLTEGRQVKFDAGVPLKDWGVVALGYLGAHQFGLSALKYIIFPMQVVCKSCKAIPVMFGERIFAGKKHGAAKVISVFLMCFGVVLFTLLGKQKDSKMGSFADTAFGLFLVFLALVCDGIYGPYQNKIVQTYKPSAYHLMFNMNLWEAVFSLLICLMSGSLFSAISFIQRNPQVLFSMGVFAATMALGNIFIYQLQRCYGALTVTTTTTLRKLISVLFSVVWFGHTLMPAQWTGVFVVFFAHNLGKVLAKPFEKKEEIKKD